MFTNNKSHIKYGIIAYGGCNKKDLKRLINLQKRAVRIVALKSRSEHTDPLYGKFEILKLEDLYSLNGGVFMYKYLNSRLPESFNGLFKLLSEPNRTRSFRLEKPKHRHLEKFPKVTLPANWNNLSLEFKTAQSLNSFKSLFKSKCFMTYKAFTCQKDAC